MPVRTTDNTNGPYLYEIKTTGTTDNVTDLNLPLSILMISLTAKRSVKRHFFSISDQSFFKLLTAKRLPEIQSKSYFRLAKAIASHFR